MVASAGFSFMRFLFLFFCCCFEHMVRLCLPVSARPSSFYFGFVFYFGGVLCFSS